MYSFITAQYLCLKFRSLETLLFRLHFLLFASQWLLGNQTSSLRHNRHVSKRPSDNLVVLCKVSTVRISSMDQLCGVDSLLTCSPSQLQGAPCLPKASNFQKASTDSHSFFLQFVKFTLISLEVGCPATTPVTTHPRGSRNVFRRLSGELGFRTSSTSRA